MFNVLDMYCRLPEGWSPRRVGQFTKLIVALLQNFICMATVQLLHILRYYEIKPH
jgi:hypothetical protein